MLSPILPSGPGPVKRALCGAGLLILVAVAVAGVCLVSCIFGGAKVGAETPYGNADVDIEPGEITVPPPAEAEP